MKRLILGLAAAALTATTLTACVDGPYDSRYAYADGDYDVYYDNHYGAFDDGYWDNNGWFYYRDARDHRYHRDDGRHVRRGAGDGYHAYRYHHRGRH